MKNNALSSFEWNLIILARRAKIINISSKMSEENLISEESRDTVKLDSMRDETINKIENLIEEQPDSDSKKNSSFQTVFSIPAE